MEKKCSKCGEVKSVTEFYKETASPDGLKRWCKTCVKAYNTENQEKIAIQRKIYRDAHKDEITAHQRIYREEHREEIAAYQRVYKEMYYREHREELVAKQKVYNKERCEEIATCKKMYYKEHREEIAARQKAYYKEHREEIAAQQKVYREEHLEQFRTYKMQHRALKAGASGRATVEQIQARWEYYGNKCYICGKDAEATDHVKPLAKGGSNWPANLRPICKRCNNSKHAKWPYDFEEARQEMEA